MLAEGLTKTAAHPRCRLRRGDYLVVAARGSSVVCGRSGRGALVAGRADALSIVDDRIEAGGRLEERCDAELGGAGRSCCPDRDLPARSRSAAGALVYLSRGEVVWVTAGKQGATREPQSP